MADGTRLNIQQWNVSNGITHKKQIHKETNIKIC